MTHNGNILRNNYNISYFTIKLSPFQRLQQQLKKEAIGFKETAKKNRFVREKREINNNKACN